MNAIQKLTEIFTHFPGIGPRQARRFVYYLLTRSPSTMSELAGYISALKNEVSQCLDCRRFFEKRHGKAELCDICADGNRDRSILMLVQRDIDLESVERNGVFNGTYFVLGGSVPIVEKEPEKRIRVQELEEKMEKSKDLIKEVILGVNANPEGENTAEFVIKSLEKLSAENKIKISHLGKGLSTGTELEYTDPETLKNALKNR